MWLENTLEYQHWGVNALTASFLISLVLTFVSAWGLVQQNRTIWRDKKAEAVSVFWLSYYGTLQLAILIYGAFTHSGALMLNGLLALFYIPILTGLRKYRGFSALERVSMGIFALAILLMVLLPYKSQFFFVLAVGGLVSALTQPIEMVRKKSAQGLNIKLIGTILLGNVVWFTYGLAVGDWVLIIVNAIAFCIFGSTAFLWWRYSRQS